MFTKHFFDSWRRRISKTDSKQKIAEKAARRLAQSRLVDIKGDIEKRHHAGDVFVIAKGNIVLTIQYSRTKHRSLGTKYYRKKICVGG